MQDKKIEVSKPVRLTPNQHIALITAANNDGVLQTSDHNVRETLRYLGLVRRTAKYAPGEVDALVKKAWGDLARAVRARDSRAAEDFITIIRSEGWRKREECWRMTPEADTYVLKGRVVVTVGNNLKSDSLQQTA